MFEGNFDVAKMDKQGIRSSESFGVCCVLARRKGPGAEVCCEIYSLKISENRVCYDSNAEEV